MADPFIGEIRMFAGTFAPQGWAFCDGQLLTISQYNALFSLLGMTYGGDGRTTFGLPDLRGRLPIHQGTGPGLSNRRIGESGGQENVTLTTAQLPAHSHPFNASTATASSADPSGNLPANAATTSIYGSGEPSVAFGSQAVTDTGGSQPHTNLMPFQCVSFIIALNGIYPARS